MCSLQSACCPSSRQQNGGRSSPRGRRGCLTYRCGWNPGSLQQHKTQNLSLKQMLRASGCKSSILMPSMQQKLIMLRLRKRECLSISFPSLTFAVPCCSCGAGVFGSLQGHLASADFWCHCSIWQTMTVRLLPQCSLILLLALSVHVSGYMLLAPCFLVMKSRSPTESIAAVILRSTMVLFQSTIHMIQWMYLCCRYCTPQGCHQRTENGAIGGIKYAFSSNRNSACRLSACS
mmetsp:Transcript_12945/g.39514  ORF Transcript_12945/g.39514 Transcript_12945/m.39514 type:complete len:233 (-) Transcript_12945:958-1656(-)